MLDAPPPPSRRFTLPEFLAWSAATEGRWQLRDGCVEPIAPQVVRHALLRTDIMLRLANWLREIGRMDAVLPGVGTIPRGSDRTILVPDIAIADHAGDDDDWVRRPTVLVEVVSQDNERQKRANAWCYLGMPTVREVVLVSSDTIAAEILYRQRDGTWPQIPLTLGAADDLRLPSVDFAAPLRAFYRGFGDL